MSSLFLSDKRTPAHKKLERKMALQIPIFIPVSETELRTSTEINHLAFGDFVHGEFVQIPDLSVRSALLSRFANEHVDKLLTDAITTSTLGGFVACDAWDSSRKAMRMLLTIGGANEEWSTVSVSNLDLCRMIASSVTPYDLPKEYRKGRRYIYVVREIRTSNRIIVQNSYKPGKMTKWRANSQPPPNAVQDGRSQKVWGYTLEKFKILRDGRLKWIPNFNGSW